MERNFLICVCVLCLFASHVTGQGAAAPTEGKIWDLVVYGGTSGGIAAAVQARRMALEVVVIEPTQRIGGLTTGGLGQTDIGNKWAVGGIAREFYRAVRAWYSRPSAWIWQKREQYRDGGQTRTDKGEDAMWTFEPSVALQIYESWIRTNAIPVVRGERLDRASGVAMTRAVPWRIVSIRMESGRMFMGKMFIDATYEGDLMAAAKVSYAVGREDNARYGESVNGSVPYARGSHRHNLAAGISAYVVPGDRASGLLPGVEPHDPDARSGAGDRRVQAYCFRMCLTDDPANRIPFARPPDYDERRYELLFRQFEARPGFYAFDLSSEAHDWRLPWINSKMPNRKTDTNNRDGFSTDFIGGSWRWPEASYAERERILKAHLSYQRGLMWTLANHPRVPETVRAAVSRWGTCRDEFADGLGDGWQGQLYVREARRLVGETVMTEHHCRGARKASRPVALGAYGMDSHHCRRVETEDGCVRNEGNMEDHVGLDGKTFRPFGIDYGALVPKKGECANLLVPVCLSASHAAFGSIRMEPVFFALGQAAATAASLALDRGCAVQDVDYGKLKARLLADGQRLAL